jgi:hypothetical protein
VRKRGALKGRVPLNMGVHQVLRTWHAACTVFGAVVGMENETMSRKALELCSTLVASLLSASVIALAAFDGGCGHNAADNPGGSGQGAGGASGKGGKGGSGGGGMSGKGGSDGGGVSGKGGSDGGGVSGSGSRGNAMLIEDNSGAIQDAPRVVMDAAGNAIAVWAQFSASPAASSLASIWANRYTPKNGWGTAVLVSDSNGPFANGGPALARDGSGNALVVWNTYDPQLNHHAEWASRYDAN